MNQMSLDAIDEPTAPLRADIDDEKLHELARSLQTAGQLQPIGLTPAPDGRLEIVFGHRRFLAAQLLGWDSIGYELVTPESKASPKAQQLIENTLRENLTPLEEARALIEMPGMPGLTAAELARTVSKGARWVTDRLKLLSLPQDTLDLLQTGAIPLGIALALGQIPDVNVRAQYLAAAVTGGCTVESAQVWLATYQAAAYGVVAAERNIDAQRERISQSAPVDQVYNCFGCAERTNYRRVDLLVLCKVCQDVIATARDLVRHQQPPEPLDSSQPM